jgi:hypothetical protein
MAPACPVCGSVTSEEGAPCARCSPLAPEQAASLPSTRPIPELDLGPRAATATVTSGNAKGFTGAAGVFRETTPAPVSLVGADEASLLGAFGRAPRNPLEAVPYAARVYRRLGELRAEREAARVSRPHEVPLYDAALVAYDERGYATGLAVAGSVVVLLLLGLVAPLLLALVH